MIDIFKDIIPSILQTKKEFPITNKKDYSAFTVNRALSFHYDCIEHANRMNLNSNIDPILQYHYYLNTIRAYKRPFQKWLKRETNEDILAIKEYYKYSETKAREVLKVLSDDQIMEIRKRTDKGGLNVKSRGSHRGDPP